MEDQRKDRLDKIGEANKHIIKIIEISTNRSRFSLPISIALAATVGILASLILPGPFQLIVFILLAAMVIVALSSKIKKGFHASNSGFTIYNKINEAEYYNWEDVKSFGFTQAPFGNGVLEISIKDQKALRFEVKTPQYDPNIGKIIDILEANIPVTKPRYFKLFKKGQHFAENRTVAFLFLVPGSLMLTAGIVFASIPLTEAISRLSGSILLCGIGFSITGIGLDILLRVIRPPLKNSLSEPIIFSKLPERLNKIVTTGALLFLIWTLIEIILETSNSLFAPYWALTVATILTVAYNLQASAWSTFEEVVVTEGKIRIRRFRKVYEAFLDDITIEISPRFFLDRLTIKTDEWKIEIGDHIVAGEKLSSSIYKLKNGQKLRPILSEEHPGFKFEYNDAD